MLLVARKNLLTGPQRSVCCYCARIAEARPVSQGNQQMRSQFLVISFAAAALLLAAAGCGGDGVTGPGKIVFVSTRDGGQEIYIMDADGSNQTRLTGGESRYDDPTWSPDATRIAFSKGGFLYVMNPDGSDQMRLTDEPFQIQLAWSPDGSRIAFSSGSSLTER